MSSIDNPLAFNDIPPGKIVSMNMYFRTNKISVTKLIGSSWKALVLGS